MAENKTEFEKYIYDVTHDKIIVCHTVKLAVNRHLKDLKKSSDPDYPYYFDMEEAYKPIQFVSMLQFEKGKFIKLLAWMHFFIGSIYGWRRKEDGRRRYSKAFLLIARQNSKTMLASALALYDVCTVSDAQSFCIANDKRQATRAFSYCRNFVNNEPHLEDFLIPLTHEIRNKGNGYLKALPAKPEHLDSFNSSISVIDEYHEMRSKALWNVISSGQVSREDPLLLVISTAGFHMDYPIFSDYEFGKRVLEGKEQLEDFFYLFFELDFPDTEKHQPEKWIKANPSIGLVCKIRQLKSEYKTSMINPADRISFEVKNLNIWTKERVNSWLSKEIWNPIRAEVVDPESLIGRDCFGGLDMSKVNDFSNLTLYFLPQEEGEKIKALHYTFIPEGSIDLKQERDAYQIREWIEKGFIIPTSGKTINNDEIVNHILNLTQLYNIIEIGTDPNYTQRISELFEFYDFDQFVEVRQGMVYFSPNIKDWEKLIRDGGAADNNPVMSYCLGNSMLYTDHNENVKVNKGAGQNKRIDLVITSIIAYSRLLAYLKDDKAADNSGFYNYYLPESDQGDRLIKKPGKKKLSFYDLLNQI